jgi:para-aminobenzoate synthetase
MKVLLLDNFDSFTLNIAQYLYEVTGTRPVVLPNTVPYADLPLREVEAVVISPGPGRPSRPADFGVCRDVIARSELPLLGVCLGHQGIAEFFGARIVRAPEPAHGVVDTVKHTGAGLFAGLPQDVPVVRYHSLVAVDIPAELEVTAWTSDGLVMAIAHHTRPMWGVQFHPESIETRGGHQILANFVTMAAHHRAGWPRPSAEADEMPPSPAVRAFRRAGGAAFLRLEARPIDRPDRPSDLFRARYAHRPDAFWLDSEDSGRPGSRYSLMGAWAGEGSVAFCYDLADRRLTLTGAHRVEQVTGDVFTLLEEILSAVEVDTPADWPLPFTGGLVGYFGYELKALTVGDERHRPTEPHAWFLHTREFVLYDHLHGRAYDCSLLALDYGEQDAAPAGAPTSSLDGAAAADTAARYVPGPVPANRLDLRHGQDEYLAMIGRAQELIVEGETYEVCLTNQGRVAAVGDGLGAYLRMRRVSPVPYGAYLRCGDFAVLSSSPETFLRVDDNRIIESRPIKGTRPRGRSAAEDAALKQDLLTSVKDRAENLMIVDLVRHDLNAVCEPGSVHVPEAFAVESYSSVHQLVSTIRGKLRWGASALAAVRACFPGGSMTGAPKKRTMEIIDELEGAPRGIYSGSIGWLSFSGALDLSVVIRTAVVRDGAASFGIGGAITAKSDPAEEFQETLVKASVPYFGLRGWQEQAR